MLLLDQNHSYLISVNSWVSRAFFFFFLVLHHMGSCFPDFTTGPPGNSLHSFFCELKVECGRDPQKCRCVLRLSMLTAGQGLSSQYKWANICRGHVPCSLLGKATNFPPHGMESWAEWVSIYQSGFTSRWLDCAVVWGPIPTWNGPREAEKAPGNPNGETKKSNWVPFSTPWPQSEKEGRLGIDGEDVLQLNPGLLQTTAQREQCDVVFHPSVVWPGQASLSRVVTCPSSASGSSLRFSLHVEPRKDPGISFLISGDPPTLWRLLVLPGSTPKAPAWPYPFCPLPRMSWEQADHQAEPCLLQLHLRNLDDMRAK